MHDKIRSILAGVVTVLATIGLSIVPTSPALAAQSDCPAATLCWWDSINYTGSRWGVSIGYILQQPGDCLVLDSSRGNNQASSIYLRSTLVGVNSLTLFDGNGGGASRGLSYEGQADANMLTSPGIASFSNVMSSICANT